VEVDSVKKLSKSPIVIAIVAQLSLAGVALAADRPKFDDLDANRDGMLSKTEATKAPGLDFARADSNKDGALSRTEYEAALS
jgi:hypothetical protein